MSDETSVGASSAVSDDRPYTSASDGTSPRPARSPVRRPSGATTATNTTPTTTKLKSPSSPATQSAPVSLTTGSEEQEAEVPGHAELTKRIESIKSVDELTETLRLLKVCMDKDLEKCRNEYDRKRAPILTAIKIRRGSNGQRQQ